MKDFKVWVEDIKPGSHVGKVFIITGAQSGTGLALLKILYPTGATIYLAGRSPAKMDQAIRDVAATSPSAATPATLETTRLDVLWDNAGVGCPAESVTKQGLEVHVGANCVAPLLSVQELLPVLCGLKSRKLVPRVNRGNPGNLHTGFYDDEPWLLMLFLKTFILYETRYGAYTMLFAGLSPLVGEGDNGAYIWPWGRIQPIARPDVLREGVGEGVRIFDLLVLHMEGKNIAG
ncbi:hypothetical protein F4804DRAFT_344645 [Jackrogersella minutella]|nr:hypothetical protein F4804DRAFT_344645 [Jackrogersella minutella]